MKSIAATRAKLRRSLGRVSGSKEYTKCKSQRENLKEINARGFNLSEEIEQAKSEEYEAKILLFDAKNGEDRAVRPYSIRVPFFFLCLCI